MRICSSCPASPVCKYCVEDPACAEVGKLVDALKPSHNTEMDEVPDTMQYQCVNCGEHFRRLEHAKLHSGECR